MDKMNRMFTAAALAALATQVLAADGPEGAAMRNLSTTYYGPIGLVTVPTAYVTPQGGLSFGTFFGKDSSIAGNYGLLASIDVGAAYLDRTGMENKAIGNAKVNFVPSNFKGFELAVGVIDFADAVNQTVYVIGSGDWLPPGDIAKGALGIRLHGGYGSGLFKNSVIGGAELVLSSQFSLIGEYNGTEVNAAARYAHDDKLRVSGGLQHKTLFLSTTYMIRF
jgi:hypothetical protein